MITKNKNANGCLAKVEAIRCELALETDRTKVLARIRDLMIENRLMVDSTVISSHFEVINGADGQPLQKITMTTSNEVVNVDGGDVLGPFIVTTTTAADSLRDNRYSNAANERAALLAIFKQ